MRPTNARATRVLAATALALSLTACGDDEVEPLPRSTLSAEVPKVRQLDLVEALPEPADLGPGWTFDTDSLGTEDYFFTFGNGPYARACRHAEPTLVGLSTVSSAYVVTGEFNPPEGEGGVTVTVAVDAPAKAADRVRFIRRALEKCDDVEITRDDGRKLDRETKVADGPEVPAGQSFTVRVEEEGIDGGTATVDAMFARVGGLVVVFEGDRDVSAAMPDALAGAREALRL